MTENEAIKALNLEGGIEIKGNPGRIAKFFEALDIAVEALEEVQHYKEMDKKLRETFGECDGLLETAVNGFCRHSDIDIGNPIKTRLLTDEDVDKWDAYREIGTVEQIKNQKENLNVAYQIISDYEQYGTIEDFEKAQKYMRLVNAHGTIGQVIDSCAEYEEIGTVEECRDGVEKQKPKKLHVVANELSGGTSYVCPNCGIEMMLIDRNHIQWGNIQRHCECCGQAIDKNLEETE